MNTIHSSALEESTALQKQIKGWLESIEHLPGMTPAAHRTIVDSFRCAFDRLSHDVQVAGASPKPTALPKPMLPSVLFDGFAVFQALPDKAKRRTSVDNVDDVLTAVVALLRTENSA